MPEIGELVRLKDLWDEQHERSLEGNQLALLRYRSNLLGADLRITNFGGGNTSSKFQLPDPFSGDPVRLTAGRYLTYAKAPLLERVRDFLQQAD